MMVCNLRTQPDNSHGSVGWLKEFNDLKGYLWIKDTCNISSLADAEVANLVSKHNLETLLLDWSDIFQIRTGLHGYEYVLPKVFSAEN